eukprot:gene10128-21122_t
MIGSIVKAASPNPKIYNNNFCRSSRFGQGFIRRDSVLGNLITVSRIVRDTDEDKSRSFIDTFIPTSSTVSGNDVLQRIAISSSEISPIIFSDISPSGLRSVYGKSGKDDIPILEFAGTEDNIGYRIDCSKIHGKIVGDSWFGGVSWTSDERFVAYVAYKKSPKRGTYFNEEIEESQRGSNFEFIEDWGEKFTGVSTLNICVLDTWTGTVTPIPGPTSDPEEWTVGQPIWAPAKDKVKGNGKGKAEGKNKNKNNNNDDEPTIQYVLAYTAWPTKPSRLGMIYCYNRPCSIFMTDLTSTLLTPPSPSKPVHVPENKNTTTNLNHPDNSLSDSISDSITPSTSPISTSTSTSSLGHQHMTESLSMARSPRFSPDGASLLFLGMKERIATHNSPSRLYRIQLNDIDINSQSSSSLLSSSLSSLYVPEVVVDVVHSPLSSSSSSPLSSSSSSPSTTATTATASAMTTSLGFPSLFCDQLPRQCFLSATGDGQGVVIDTYWGVRQSIVIVDLATKTIQRMEGLDAILDTDNDKDSGTGTGNDNSYGSVSLLDVLPGIPAGDNSDSSSSSAHILFHASTPVLPSRLGLISIPLSVQPLSVSLTPVNNIGNDIVDGIGGDTDGRRRRLYIGPYATPAAVVMKSALTGSATDKPNILSSPLPALRWRVLTQTVSISPPLSPSQSSSHPDVTADVTATLEHILILPPKTTTTTTSAPLPLIVVPHGGPHSNFVTAFTASNTFLVTALNAAVLFVNYRGSTGFGAGVLDALPGNIGDMDVKDVVTATELALALYEDEDDNKDNGSNDNSNNSGKAMLCDRNRVAVVGGSHGGFLAAHMIGQHPDLYKVAAMRNPVIDISAMISSSDIPDWCVAETFSATDSFSSSTGPLGFDPLRTVNKEAVLKLWSCSPVAWVHNVRAPTLLCVGLKDRRVPPAQGLYYHQLLKAKRGVPTRLMVFPEDCHAIDRPKSEADQWLTIAAWLEQYL